MVARADAGEDLTMKRKLERYFQQYFGKEDDYDARLLWMQREDERLPLFTGEERVILDGLRKGKSYAEMANDIGRRQTTVRERIFKILRNGWARSKWPTHQRKQPNSARHEKVRLQIKKAEANIAKWKRMLGEES